MTKSQCLLLGVVFGCSLIVQLSALIDGNPRKRRCVMGDSGCERNGARVARGHVRSIGEKPAFRASAVTNGHA
jgi:hypothetical protein